MKLKNITNRVLSFVLITATILTFVACGKAQTADKPEEPSAPPASQTTVNWPTDSDATFSAVSPEDDLAVQMSEPIFQVGKTASGADFYALEHFDISADFLAGEVSEARLFLKLTSDIAPKQLKITPLTGAWDGYFSTRKEVDALIDVGASVNLDVKAATNGWISVPITDIARTWLDGGLQNNGFAICGVTEGETYSLTSTYGESDTPYIAVTGAVGDRPLNYGKFGYTKTPLPNALDMGGNCMSYALRDTNMILGSDMGGAPDALANAYISGGADAIADYLVPLVLEYVDANKEGLQISKIRQIDSYDSEIDPKSEYRIAMRVGTDKYAEIPDFTREGAYDYHFWLQLNDGRWAQKYPTGDSLIVPCTAHDIDPGKYPWSAGYNWSEKNRDYETSKTIYFAVTKDTDEITRHRGETEDRNFDDEDDMDFRMSVPTEDEAKAVVKDLIAKAAAFYGSVYNGGGYFEQDDSVTIPGTSEAQGGNPYVLVADENVKTMDDLRAATERVFMPEIAEKLFYSRYLTDVDKPVDELDYANAPLYYEYEGRLYVNTNIGGKGFPLYWLIDTTEITELTVDRITATVERTSFNEPDGVSTIVLEKWGGEWVIANDFAYGEGE